MVQKCDAVRPNCGTCVRSHKHHMRISPETTGPLCCEYDDGTGAGNGIAQGGERGSPSVDMEDEDGEAAKKKKKRSGDNKRKSRKDEEDDETEKLRKKIGELSPSLVGSG